MRRAIAVACLLLGVCLLAATAQATVHFAEVGMWGGQCDSVATVGSRAYVAQGNCLVIYDLTNPASPVRLGYISLQDEISKIVVSGQYAYVLWGWDGQLQIVDVSDPAKPVAVGRLVDLYGEFGGFINDIAVSGSAVYIANTNGIFKLDVSDASRPTLAEDWYSTGGYEYFSLATYGSYMLYTDACLMVVDFSEPWGIMIVGSLPDVTAVSLTVSGSYVYAACGGKGVKIIDLSDPSNPILVATIDTPGSAQQVEVSGNHAYVADGTSGVQVLDITDPAHPALIGSLPMLCWATDIALSAGHAVVADRGRGFRIVDVSTPSSPTTAYTHDAGRLAGLAVLGSTALASNSGRWSSLPRGLYSVDVSEPTAPTELNWMPAPAIGQFTLHDGRAYLLDRSWEHPNCGVSTFDVSNPASPALLSHLVWDSYATSVAFCGRYAFVGGDKKISVVDIADAASPFVAGSVASAGSVWCVAVSGSYLYAGSYWGGLEVFSIADPLHPVLVSSYTQWRPSRILPVNDLLYVSGSSLWVLDKSDPAHPTQTAAFPMSCSDLLLSGSVLYASSSSGIAAFDVVNPRLPALVGQWTNVGGGAVVAVNGDIAYALSGGTLRVLRMEQADTSVVYGRVLDAKGCPLYSARVSACGITANTDSQGYYVLGDLPPGENVLTATSDGWAPQTKACTLTANHSIQVDLTFPLATVSGRVTDSLNNPVSGAAVGVSSQNAPSERPGPPVGQAPVLTGPDGEYSIPDVYPDEYAVVASKAGYDSGYSYLTVTGGQDNHCDVIIPLPGNIVVRVTDPRGVPVSGVTIKCVQFYYPNTTYTASTGSDGTYTFRNLRLGPYEVKLSRNSRDVAVKNAYVPGGLTATCDLTLADQLAITHIGSCLLGGEPSAICVAGNRAYVACGSLGLAIVDVSDPENPALTGMCVDTGSATDVAIQGQYACVAAGTAGLRVIDVSDPAHPALVATCAAGDATGVAMQGDYAYVADRAGRLVIVSIHDPAHPVEVRHVEVAAACKVVVSGNYALVSRPASDFGVTRLVDISDPARPRARESFYTAPSPDIAISGGFGFASDSYRDFAVLDLSCPYPTRVCSLDTGFGSIVRVSDSRAYAVDSTHGLCVLDISTPTDPLLLAASTYTANGLAASGDYAYVTDPAGYLRIYDILRPAITSLAPTMGYNDSTVSITNLAGRAFKAGCSVALTRPGQPDIIASNVDASPEKITCMVDLTGAVPGYWSVRVTNPDGKTGRGAQNGFLVKVSSSARRVGLRIRDASDAAVAAGARDHRFVVWGRVQSVSPTLITIDDGNTGQIAIVGTGFTGISVRSFISACGTLDPASAPPCLFCQPADIVKRM